MAGGSALPPTMKPRRSPASTSCAAIRLIPGRVAGVLSSSPRHRSSAFLSTRRPLARSKGSVGGVIPSTLLWRVLVLSSESLVEHGGFEPPTARLRYPLDTALQPEQPERQRQQI